VFCIAGLFSKPKSAIEAVLAPGGGQCKAAEPDPVAPVSPPPSAPEHTVGDQEAHVYDRELVSWLNASVRKDDGAKTTFYAGWDSYTGWCNRGGFKKVEWSEFAQFLADVLGRVNPNVDINLQTGDCVGIRIEG
jgi:hypothetical protein